MFAVRIAIGLYEGWDINIDKEILIHDIDKLKCSIDIYRNENVVVIIKYGVFELQEIAENEGEKLLNHFKKLFAKKGIPIKADNINNRKDNGLLTSLGKENLKEIFKTINSKTVIGEYYGIGVFPVENSIYDLDHKYTFTSFSAQLRCKKKNFLNYGLVEFNQKLKLAYDFLNLSLIISDDNVLSFVLKVFCIETIIPKYVPKDNDYREILKKFKRIYITKTNLLKLVDSSNQKNFNNIIKDMFNDITSKFGDLKNKSIKTNAEDLFSKCNLSEINDYKTPFDFWKEYYSVRSGYVHSGNSNIEFAKKNIKVLHKLVCEVLEGYEKHITLANIL